MKANSNWDECIFMQIDNNPEPRFSGKLETSTDAIQGLLALLTQNLKSTRFFYFYEIYFNDIFYLFMQS